MEYILSLYFNFMHPKKWFSCLSSLQNQNSNEQVTFSPIFGGRKIWAIWNAERVAPMKRRITTQFSLPHHSTERRIKFLKTQFSLCHFASMLHTMVSHPHKSPGCPPKSAWPLLPGVVPCVLSIFMVYCPQCEMGRQKVNSIRTSDGTILLHL